MNKTILITGAAKRIGKEIALTYSDLGWNIIIHFNSSKDDAEKLANQINSKNPNTAKIIQANLDVDSEVMRLVNEAKGLFETIDILVNNAGILRDKSFHKVTIEEFNQVMDVHFQGSFYASHAVYPIMREQNFGRIIFTTSSGGLVGSFGQTNYGAAKMGMIGLMNCLKIEGQKYNVFSSAVSPVALSRMTESLMPEGIGE